MKGEPGRRLDIITVREHIGNATFDGSSRKPSPIRRREVNSREIPHE
jgi:hypothetical protein